MYLTQGIAYNNNFQMDQIHRKLSLPDLPSYIGKDLYDVRFLLKVCQDLRLYFRFYHFAGKVNKYFCLAYISTVCMAEALSLGCNFEDLQGVRGFFLKKIFIYLSIYLNRWGCNVLYGFKE